jgi:hypothetical protein
MVKDCIDYGRKCQCCQLHANLIHQPLKPLHLIVVFWPLSTWGLDMVGPLLKSSRVYLYILTAIYYFLKWVEVTALKKIKKKKR